MAKLRVMFSGLCAFVPSKTDPNLGRVILVDARVPSKNCAGKSLDAHVPIVFYSTGNGSGRALNAAKLDLHWEYIPKVPGANINLGLGNHVVNMNNIHTNCAFAPDVLAGGANPSQVVSRCFLQGGELAPVEFVEGYNWKCAKETSGDESYYQLASHVQWEVEILPEPALQYAIVTLRGVPFDHPRQSVEIKLRERNGFVDVTVSNLCGCPTPPKGKPLEDDSFGWYYQLLKDWQTSTHCAVPRHPGPGASDTFCPGVIFNPEDP